MKVYISATLRNFFGRNPVIEISENNIKEILDKLTDEYPEAEKILFDEEGNLRKFVQIYVGDENKTQKEFWSDEIKDNFDRPCLVLLGIK